MTVLGLRVDDNAQQGSANCRPQGDAVNLASISGGLGVVTLAILLVIFSENIWKPYTLMGAR